MAKEILFNIRINVQDEKELKTTQTRMDQLIARQKELTKQNKRSTTEYQKNAIELKAIRKEHSQLSNNLVRQNQLQKTQVNTLGRVNAELAIQRQKIKDVVIGSQQFKKTAARIKELETKQRQYNAAIGRSTTFVGEYSKGFINAFQKIGTAIFAAVASFRVFINLIKSAITDYADFETGQLNVQSLLDQFDETLEKRSIKLMTTYGLKMEDVNKAMFDAVSAGVPAAELMEFMAASAKLAISGVTDLTTATGAIAKAINVYGLELNKANDIADMFFTTQKKGVTTVALVASNFGKAAVIAEKAGIEFEEFMATFAGLTKVMDSTEETATTLRSMIAALIDPSAQAKKAFEKLKIETGLTAMQQNGLFNTIEKIIQATKDNSDVVTELFPNVRALTGALAINEEKMQEMHEVYELVKTDIGETSSATIAFETHMESLNKRMDITKAKIKEQSIALGKTLKPVWLGILEIIEELISKTRLVIDFFGIMANPATASGKLIVKAFEIASASIHESGKKTKEEIEAAAAEATAAAEEAAIEKQKLSDEEFKNFVELEKLRIETIIDNTEKEIANEILKHEIAFRKYKDNNELLEAELGRHLFALAQIRIEHEAEEREKEREDQEFLAKQELESEKFIAAEILELEKESRKLTEDAEKKHLEKIDKLRIDNLKKEEKRIQSHAKLIYEFAADIGVAVENALLAEEKGFEKFAKAIVLSGLALLRKQVYIAIAESLVRGIAKGPWGIVEAGIKITAIEAAYGAARALVLKMGRGGEVPGVGDKDTVSIMATPKEGIINARSMQSPDFLTLTGRPFDIASQLNSYKGFGIPFNTGGVVSPVTNNTYNNLNEDTIRSIVDQLNAREIKVYQNVHEVIEAQQEIKVIQETGEI